MYPLLETLRIENGQVKNLKFHKERLNTSFDTLFGKEPAFELEKIIRAPVEFSKGRVKCRLLYGEKGYKIEYSYYNPQKIDSLKLVFDNDIEYSLKFSNRKHLNLLWEGRRSCDDILIVKNGLVTDTSFSNVIFFDGTKWVTPDKPLLEGTCRQRLLEKNVLVSAPVSKEDLRRFESFKLINAMIDFTDMDPIPINNIRL